MKECIFCKIVSGEAKSYVVDENEKYMAFLDIFPPTFNGIVSSPNIVVIPKKHFESNIFEDLPDDVYNEILIFTKQVAKKIQKNLRPMRVCMVSEGMEIEHFHIKLFPIFEEFYPGYLSTEKGFNNKATLASDEYLDKILKKIRRNQRNL